MQQHDLYMQRCLQLAEKGLGAVAPNPMVGAVLVKNDKIISEGYHQKYGGPHAEVHALHNLSPQEIAGATLYVSLEPCSHYGKTPPCAALLIEKKVEHVVVACLDPNPKVAGKGIAMLKEAGIKVETGILESEAQFLNRAFITQQVKKRPYIILKWASSANGLIAPNNNQSITWLSHPNSQVLNHKWRSEVDAILVGSNTFNTDKPSLDVRKWSGSNPSKIVLCSKTSSLNKEQLENWAKTKNAWIVAKKIDNTLPSGITAREISSDFITEIIQLANEQQWQSIIIEGGSKTQQGFVDANCWDEARIIRGQGHIENGIAEVRISGKLHRSVHIEGGDLYQQILAR